MLLNSRRAGVEAGASRHYYKNIPRFLPLWFPRFLFSHAHPDNKKKSSCFLCLTCMVMEMYVEDEDIRTLLR